MTTLSREVPVDPVHAALLIVDVQNYCVSGKSEKTEYFRQSLCGMVLPKIQRLQHACRRMCVEVIYWSQQSGRSAMGRVLIRGWGREPALAGC